MSQERGSALYELLRCVRPLVLNSARVVEAALRPHGLTVGGRAVLEMLVDRGPMTAPAIAARLDLARQGVQRHVNELLALGYVESRVNPAHRRSSLIVPTSAGAAVFALIRRDELRDLATLAPGCSADEIAVATRVLRAVEESVRDRAHPLVRAADAGSAAHA
ncbi:MarR family winged helix-turn-helix transcriptional regulator [Frankia sp. AgB32]|uniref:MarR family winged helix-turn-helix transcriptional regulator n=1 Tax=Frankia sp. AgB32 TaxID=631119 RepID=UPI00200D81E0|nr:MarR family winged helix-turn-helix transcriptional regulator [Frankia sp. AgB32]MCK9895273.1 MarR family winged helix-turn-helix transcriptional regulator [Frankia sp. AgB32]